MYSVPTLNMGIAEIRQNLLPLAYQHASPAKLITLYQTLYSVRAVDLPKHDAVTAAMGLAMKRAAPSLLGPLFSSLYSISGINLPKKQAQQMSIDLTAAGADAEKLQASFKAAKSKMSKEAALQLAVADSVDANLAGLATRYAKDGKAYTAKEFQSYYGQQWFSEWQAAPQQKRTARDGKDYLASEFLEHFGASWSAKWNAAPVATLRRIAADGKTYTMDEFQKYYGDNWQSEWSRSSEVLDVCAGLDRSSCDAQAAKCQWSWTGDWTDSCVVKPLAASVAIEI